MRKWYVIQVLSGREDAVLAAIRRRIDADGAAESVLSECFALRYQAQQKVHGRWRQVERKLIPGYLIAVSADAAALDRELGRIEPFARLLKNEDGFIPLDAGEVAWIEAFTKEGHRSVGLSTAVKEGDRVIVTDGPLRTQSARIVRVDRRRGVAYIQISFLGREKQVPVGLRILAKRND